MKLFWITLAVSMLAACDGSPATLSYEQLKAYPVSCELKETQLAELKKLQAIKNFDPDPDNLNEQDRIYNSRLKATIWWYAYGCDQ
jgi:hypothetical protein